MPTEPICVTQNLQTIFPDDGNELCSRHTALLSSLKNTFQETYAQLDPQYFVILRGRANIISFQKSLEMSLLLQNGLVFLVSKTYMGDPIYINGKNQSTEIILENNGKYEEGKSPIIDNIEQYFHSKQERSGGIIYFSNNIQQGSLGYPELFELGLYICNLLISDTLGSTSRKSIIETIMAVNPDLNQNFLDSQVFLNEHNCLLTTIQSSKMKIGGFNPDWKFIMCKLGISKEQQKIIQGKRRSSIEHHKKIVNMQKIQDQVINSLKKAEETYWETFKLNKELLQKYVSNQIDLPTLITEKQKLDLNFNVHDRDVQAVAKNVCEELAIDHYCIAQDEYLLMLVSKKNYSNILYNLKNMINTKKLCTQKVFLETEKLESRFDSSYNLSDTLFTTIPASGVAVYDPSTSLWFC